MNFRWTELHFMVLGQHVLVVMDTSFRYKYRMIEFRLSIHHLGLANLEMQSTSTINLNT